MELKRKQAEEVSMLKKNLSKITLDLGKSNSELKKIKTSTKPKEVVFVDESEHYQKTEEENDDTDQDEILNAPSSPNDSEDDQEEQEQEKDFSQLPFDKKWYEVMTNILPKLPLVNSIPENVTFLEYIQENTIFANFMHTAFDIVYKYADSVVQKKMVDMLAVLGIKTGSDIHNNLMSTMTPFWQQNSEEIFSWRNHRQSLFRCYTNEFKVACEKNLKIGVTLIENEELLDQLEKLFNLAITMCINPEKITVQLERSLFHKNYRNSLKSVKFKKDKFYLIHDLKDNKECALIMPSPMCNSEPYMGIKPCVINFDPPLFERAVHPNKKVSQTNTKLNNDSRSASYTMLKMPTSEIYVREILCTPKGYKSPKKETIPVTRNYGGSALNHYSMQNLGSRNQTFNSRPRSSFENKASTNYARNQEFSSMKRDRNSSSSLRKPYLGNYRHQGYSDSAGRNYEAQMNKGGQGFSYLNL